MAAAVPSIRVFQMAEALRPSLEEELKERFTVYTPVSCVQKEGALFEVEVRTQKGQLKLQLTQASPESPVRYVSHSLTQ